MKRIDNLSPSVAKKASSLGYIWKTVGISAASFIILLFIVMTFVTLGAPIALAKFYDNCGFSSLAYSTRDVAYRNSDDIENNHTMLTASVYHKNYSNVIYYGEKMLNASNYDLYTETVNKVNYAKNLNDNIVLRISVGSENNFIKNSYTLALIKKNRTVEARKYALQNLEDLAISFSAKSAFVLPTLQKCDFTLTNNEIDKLVIAYEKCKKTEKIFDTTINGYENDFLKFEKKIMQTRLSEMAIILYENLNTETYKAEYENYLAAIIAK